MVSFSPKRLPPVFLQHNGRWTRLEESERLWEPDWFPLLIQLSWCREGFTRMYLSIGVCQQRQEAIKNIFPTFFPFNCCISDESCSLSCCETCKSAAAHMAHTPLPAAAAVVVVFCLLLPFTWMVFFWPWNSQRHRCRVDWAPTLLYIN